MMTALLNNNVSQHSLFSSTITRIPTAQAIFLGFGPSSHQTLFTTPRLQTPRCEQAAAHTGQIKPAPRVKVTMLLHSVTAAEKDRFAFWAVIG